MNSFQHKFDEIQLLLGANVLKSLGSLSNKGRLNI